MPTDYDEVFGEIVFDDDADLTAIQAAIDTGHEINCIENSDHWNLLHYVLVDLNKPNVAVVRLAIENGGKVNQPDRTGWTPLHFAARSGCDETLRLLLDAGADPNLPDDDGVTPFHRYFVEAEAIDSTIVQLFIDHGGKPTKNHLRWATNVEYPEKPSVLPLLKTALED